MASLIEGWLQHRGLIEPPVSLTVDELPYPDSPRDGHLAVELWPERPMWDLAKRVFWIALKVAAIIGGLLILLFSWHDGGAA